MRAVVWVWVSIWLTLTILVGIPLMFVLHPLFRLFGRVGTIRPAPDDRYDLILNCESFRKRAADA